RPKRNRPEGKAVSNIPARQFHNLGVVSSTERSKSWPFARQFAGELEKTENEFTLRAQQIKIDILYETGAFSRPLNRLLTFADCYIVAQYEALQLRHLLNS